LEKIQDGSKRDRPHSISFTNAPSKTAGYLGKDTRVDSVLKKYATQGVDVRNAGVFMASVASAPFGRGETQYDYQVMLNEVRRTEEYFRRLPVRIREKFANSAINMVRFMADRSNLEECQKLGLITPEPEAPPAPPPPAPPAPEKKP